MYAAANGSKAASSSDSDDSSDEEGKGKAPNQLIMEFLQCVMSNDLDNGLKLCKMSKYTVNHLL